MADRLKRSLTAGCKTDVIAVYNLTFQTADRQHYRLEGVARHAMAGTQVIMTKAETTREGIAACFMNEFQAKSQPLQADILFTELEYDIVPDKDGYESSRWLRFVKPIRPQCKKAESCFDLVSAVDLPNPLRRCPPTPVLIGHTCSIQLETQQTAYTLLEESTEPFLWDYQLTFRFPYQEQDTLHIRVEFEALDKIKRTLLQRDLFDALAEYQLVRESLLKTLTEQPGESATYQAAYATFAQIAQETAGLWQSWTAENSGEIGGRTNGAALAYSCTAEGTLCESGMQFRVSATEEGKAFWKQLGLTEQTPLLEAIADGEEMQLQFTIRGLPIFSCAQAVPSVSVVRNQNLLTGERGSLQVREDFLYRTQEVVLLPLTVSGEYHNPYLIAALTVPKITRDTMEQAVLALYHALGLGQSGLEAEISVFYQYHLVAGRPETCIELPVTLVACAPTFNALPTTAWVKTLTDNLYQWYEQVKPSSSGCSLRFDVKLYQEKEQKCLLRFSHLTVAFRIQP